MAAGSALAPDIAAGRALWTAILTPDAPAVPCSADALAAAVKRFAKLTAPTVAAWLAAPLLARAPGLIPAGDVERTRQFVRFMRARAAPPLAAVAAAGIEVLALKGLATAARFYPDPLLRVMGDVDVLVRPGDVGRFCDVLEGEGFRFLKSAETPAWGLATESSFHPMVAPDGAFSFDIHVAADDYPVPRALGVGEVFAAAQQIPLRDISIGAPSDDHLFLLAITHAGRDKFGADSLRGMADVVAALVHARLAPDWDGLVARARRGGFARPLTTAVNLLARLGLAPELLPARLIRPYRGLAGHAFDALLHDYLTVFAERPSRVALQARDWLVISEPRALAWRNWRRVRGLVRPWTGLPSGRAFDAREISLPVRSGGGRTGVRRSRGHRRQR